MHDKVEIPDCDVLIHTGDFCIRGKAEDAQEFVDWFASIPIPEKIFIAGNHDRVMETHPHLVKIPVGNGVTYLEDRGVTIMGYKFWGSPVSPAFNNWAFNRTRGPQIKEHWDRIPEGTDVLITHGPPLGILDFVAWDNKGVGCKDLLFAVTKIRPSLHCFSHVHGGYGLRAEGTTLFANGSFVNEDYNPINKPHVVELDV